MDVWTDGVGTGNGVEAELGELGGEEPKLGLPMEVSRAGGGEGGVLSTRVPKWVLREFTSSARSDGLKLKHWEKEAVVREDYIFAQFCSKKAEVVRYSDEEYERFCQSRHWSKEMTDTLIDMAEAYGCRWHVIADRFPFAKTLEEIKDRYYTVVRNMAAAYCAALAQRGGVSAKALASKVPVVDKPYSREYEERRKNQAEAFYFASQAMMEEQAFLRAKLVEMGLAKPKPSRSSSSSGKDSKNDLGRGPGTRVNAMKRTAAQKARTSFRTQILKHIAAVRAESKARALAEAKARQEEERAQGGSQEGGASSLTTTATSVAATEAGGMGGGSGIRHGTAGDLDALPPVKRMKTLPTLEESVVKSKKMMEMSKRIASRSARSWIAKSITRVSGVLSKKKKHPQGRGVFLRSRECRAEAGWAPQSISSDTTEKVNDLLDGIGLATPLPTPASISAFRELRGQAFVLAEVVSAASNLRYELEILRKRVQELGLEA